MQIHDFLAHDVQLYIVVPNNNEAVLIRLQHLLWKEFLHYSLFSTIQLNTRPPQFQNLLIDTHFGQESPLSLYILPRLI